MRHETKQELRDLFFHVLFWIGTGFMFYAWSKWFIRMNPVYNFTLTDMLLHVVFLLAATGGWRWILNRIAKPRNN